MVTRRERGFTLMEVVISLALFGVFLFIIGQLTSEMRYYEKRYPVNFMAHPQVNAVIARLRKDVYDSTEYPETYETYTMGKQTLILETLQESGFIEHVVWDFSTPGQVRRLAFNVGNQKSEWIARGLPNFKVVDYPIEGHPDSVRIQATDQNGRLAVDQIIQPRPHA